MHSEIHTRKIKLQYFLALVSLLVALLTFRLPYEFHRLLFSASELAAIDLRQRYDEVQAWFSGEQIYGSLNSAVYPPASYLVMWPFMGFPSWTLVRWVWALSSIILLAYLIRMLLKEASIDGFRQRLLWSLFVMTHYAVGINVGNGQLTIHIMAAILGSIALLTASQSSWHKILLAGGLAALSLVKPTVAVPFMWLILWIPNNIYPALATVSIYTLLALIASLFQSAGALHLHLNWLTLGIKGAAWGSKDAGEVHLESFWRSNIKLSGDVGYGDVHSLLEYMGMSDLALITSLILLALLGIWVYLYRDCNTWILLGVTAVFSRIWTYHRVYDDILIIFAIFGLLITLKLELSPRLQQAGNFLLGLLVIASLIPTSLRLFPAPFNWLFKVGQLSLWMTTLFYLLHAAYLEKQTRFTGSTFVGK